MGLEEMFSYGKGMYLQGTEHVWRSRVFVSFDQSKDMSSASRSNQETHMELIAHRACFVHTVATMGNKETQTHEVSDSLVVDQRASHTERRFA